MVTRNCGLCECWLKQETLTRDGEDGKEHSIGFGECRARSPRIPPFTAVLPTPESEPSDQGTPIEGWLWPWTFEDDFCVHDFRLKAAVEGEQAKILAMFTGSKGEE